MADRLHKMADMLLELEGELRRLERWENESPSHEMLQSTAPFSADRLSIEQWLQWVFIPGIKQIIEANGELPDKCEIHPYAEEYLQPQSPQLERLLQLIQEIDRHLSEE